MKHEFRRDFVGTNVGDMAVAAAMIAPLAETLNKHAERWRARDREIPLLQLGRSDNQRRRGRPNTLLVWLVVLSESALCRCQKVDVRACAACCVPLRIKYTLYQRSEAQVWYARVCPNRGINSTGLQHQLQQQ